MKIYVLKEKQGLEKYQYAGPAALCRALHISMEEPLLLSLVGAGGKTTVMQHLAKELSAVGKRVIITTSTHIYRPAGQEIYDSARAVETSGALDEAGIAVVGRESAGGKLEGLPAEKISRLLRCADAVLVEADGAKGMPLKAPAAHEPCIVPGSTHVIICAGLDCVRKPFAETCFRLQAAVSLLGVDEETLVTEEHVADLLTSEKGGRKAVSDIPCRVILNKADDIGRLEMGKRILKYLDEKDMKGVLTCFQSAGKAAAL